MIIIYCTTIKQDATTGGKLGIQDLSMLSLQRISVNTYFKIKIKKKIHDLCKKKNW